jgi:4'-phosphopantetheinyl transferase
MTSIFATRIFTDDDFMPLKERLLTFLSEERRIQVTRYRKAADLQRSLTGELLVKALLSEQAKLRHDELLFRQSPNGKLFCENLPDIHFNISHSGEWVVVVVSDRQTGVDIEFMGRYNPEIAERYFTREETACLNRLKAGDRVKGFFELWTAKESYVKALGQRLPSSLKSFTVAKEKGIYRIASGMTRGEQYYFRQYDLDPSYCLSVCSSSPDFRDAVSFVTMEEIITMLRASVT